jgi:hypothetical protein
MPKNLYWCYGSNLNVRQMRKRCRDATVFGPLVVPNAVLRFRGVADVAYLRGAECHGGLWEISKRDEEALDRYEGVDLARPERGLYVKRYLTLKIKGEVRRALYYQMNATGIMPPSQAYLDVIAQGFRDFGLPLERLQRAVDHSWARQRKTPLLRDRWRRKGAPRLAREVERQAELPFDYQTECENPACEAFFEATEDYCPECGEWRAHGRVFELRRGK